MAQLNIDTMTGSSPSKPSTSTSSSAQKYNEEVELLKDVESIRSELGIEQKGKTNFNSFNVYKNFENEDFLSSGISYIFFTKPCLHFGDNILSSLKNDVDVYKKIQKSNFFRTCPFIDDIVNRKSFMYRNILNSLKGGSGFIHFITNLVQNFETQDATTETFTASDTFKGYKLTLPGGNVESQVSGTFSISYNETRNMDITVFHKVWLDYIDGVRRGVILPSADAIRRFDKSNMTNNGYIEYMNSAYYFLLDADGKTIKYYAKYTGVFPTNVPYSAFNWELGNNSQKKVTINYQYNFKEDMNPEILKEFNYVAGLPNGENKIQLHAILPETLETYVKSQKASNGWKTYAKVAMLKGENGETHDYLIFD